MNRDVYRRKVNQIVLSCYVLTGIAMAGCYGISFYQGYILPMHFAHVIGFLFVPIGVSLLFDCMTKRADWRLRYVIATRMLLFYTYVMLTARSRMIFVFVIPMVAILCVYADAKLVSIFGCYTVIINIINVVTNYRMGANSAYDIIEYEIQIGCIVMAAVFIYLATRLIRMDSDRLLELSQEVDQDELTGAYNRHFFSSNIERLEALAGKKYGLSLAFIDIDNFRAFNSEHGHDLGDLVLQKMAEQIMHFIRDYPGTYLVRMGGDEFIILGTEHSSEKFASIIHKMKYHVNQTLITYEGKELCIGISVGVANEQSDGCLNYLDLYRLADKRLYNAKETGKNKVIYSDKMR